MTTKLQVAKQNDTTAYRFDPKGTHWSNWVRMIRQDGTDADRKVLDMVEDLKARGKITQREFQARLGTLGKRVRNRAPAAQAKTQVPSSEKDHSELGFKCHNASEARDVSDDRGDIRVHPEDMCRTGSARVAHDEGVPVKVK